MTNLLQQQLLELTHALQLHLMEQYHPKAWLNCAQPTHAYFQKLVQAKPLSYPSVHSHSISPPSAVNPVTSYASLPLASVPIAVLPKEQPTSTPMPSIPSAPTVSHSTSLLPIKPKETAPVLKESLAKEQESKKPRLFVLEPLPPTPLLDLSDIKATMKEKFPALVILDQIPHEQQALSLTPATKVTPILILAHREIPTHLNLLTNIATALTTHFLPTALQEVETLIKSAEWASLGQAPGLAMIIGTQPALDQLKQEKQAAALLSNPEKITVIILEDLDLYLKNPQKKLHLWKTLRQHILNLSL